MGELEIELEMQLVFELEFEFKFEFEFELVHNLCYLPVIVSVVDCHIARVDWVGKVLKDKN